MIKTFTISQVAEKNIHSNKTNKDYTIVTFLTTDNEKIKAWGGQYTSSLKAGQEVEGTVEIKKDRDGFDEVWLKIPNSGFGGARTYNTWPQAYQTAIQFMIAKEVKMTEKNLSDWAVYFHNLFEGGAVKSPEAKSNKVVEEKPKEKVIQVDEEPAQESTATYNADEINPDEIPW